MDEGGSVITGALLLTGSRVLSPKTSETDVPLSVITEPPLHKHTLNCRHPSHTHTPELVSGGIMCSSLGWFINGYA